MHHQNFFTKVVVILRCASGFKSERASVAQGIELANLALRTKGRYGCRVLAVAEQVSKGAHEHEKCTIPKQNAQRYTTA